MNYKTMFYSIKLSQLMKSLVLIFALISAIAAWDGDYQAGKRCDSTICCCPAPNSVVRIKTENNHKLSVYMEELKGSCGPFTNLSLTCEGDLTKMSFTSNVQVPNGAVVAFTFTQEANGRITILNAKIPLCSFDFTKSHGVTGEDGNNQNETQENNQNLENNEDHAKQVDHLNFEYPENQGADQLEDHEFRDFFG
jgi:hypothetical protein